METVRLTSLDNLQYFTSMTSFTLNHGDQVSDLSPLASLTQLTTLYLTNCKQISDLSPLASLKQLTSFALMHCEQVGDLSTGYHKYFPSLTMPTRGDRLGAGGERKCVVPNPVIPLN